MDQATVDKCQAMTGYTFSDVSLLELALTHASVASSRVQSNERLEFLGDSVLALVVCEELYGRSDELLEGEMTKIKSSVVSGHTCAEIAAEMGLSDLGMISKGLQSSDGPPPSVTAAMLEAIIGAVFLDGGLAAARSFIRPKIRIRIENAMATEHQDNYKSVLQQHSQRRWGITPTYQLLDEKGPDHRKAFEVAITIQGVHYPSGWGRTKKQAEQAAALRALMELGVIQGDGSHEV